MKKIKSIKAWDKSDEDPFLKSLVEFDENGNETRKETYFGPGELESKTMARFDEKGLLTEEINFDENNTETDRTTVERDSEGLPVKTTLSYADGSKTFKTYLRENNRKSITMTEISDEGEFESREKVLLDDNGHVIERIAYNEQNEIMERHTFEFDDDHNIVHEMTYQGDSLVSESKNYYDETKNLVKRIILNAVGESIDWAVYTYDEKGKLTEQQYGDHTLYKMEYNEKGMLVMEQKVNAMGVVDYNKEYVYSDEDLLMEEIDYAGTTRFEYEFYKEE
jgi:hypothetical protein